MAGGGLSPSRHHLISWGGSEQTRRLGTETKQPAQVARPDVADVALEAAWCLQDPPSEPGPSHSKHSGGDGRQPGLQDTEGAAGSQIHSGGWKGWNKLQGGAVPRLYRQKCW